MIYCLKEHRNVEIFYCEVVCENKHNYIRCPFRKTAQIQLDLWGKPIDETPALLAKQRQKMMKNPDKYHPNGDLYHKI